MVTIQQMKNNLHLLHFGCWEKRHINPIHSYSCYSYSYDYQIWFVNNKTPQFSHITQSVFADGDSVGPIRINLSWKMVHRYLYWCSKVISLLSLEELSASCCLSRTNSIIRNPSHLAHHLFKMLPSGRHFRSNKAQATRLNSFFTWTICAINKNYWCAISRTPEHLKCLTISLQTIYAKHNVQSLCVLLMCNTIFARYPFNIFLCLFLNVLF